MRDTKTWELERRVQTLERHSRGAWTLGVFALSVALIAIYLLLTK